MAALAETAFLIALSIGVAALAVRRLGEHGEVVAGGFAFAAVLISIVVDILRWRALRRVAAETGSDAIAADALHYAGDLVGSGLVLVGLVATRAGAPGADALAAIGVALFIAVSGYRLGARTIDALIDAAPRGPRRRRASGAERRRPGVVGVDYLRLRRIGADAVGELGLFVSRTQSLEGVAAIRERAAAMLARRWPRLS